MISKDQVLEHADLVVDVLGLLATVTSGTAKQTAETVDYVTRALIRAIQDRISGDVDAATVDEHINSLRDNLKEADAKHAAARAAGDTEHDAALARKFSTDDEG